MAACKPTRRHGKTKDEVGNVYGKLIVISYAGVKQRTDGRNYAIWQCRCECGNIAAIAGRYLRTRHVTACSKSCRRVTHGQSRRGANTPEYRCWVRIRTRCYDPKCNYYHNYGGRGIRVCERWLDGFENFFADMGPKPSPKHSIDRIDNNGNYEPDNCRWALKQEQDNNRRTNRFITHNGVTLTLTQWARRLGVSPRQVVGAITHN